MTEIPATSEITSMMDKLIPLMLQLGLVMMLGMGIVLWLIGQRMVRSACIFAGLVVGGMVSFLVCQQTTTGSAVLFWVMGGSIAGAVSAVFLFRMWMGIVLMLMMGLVVPAAVLLWQGDSGPINGENLRASITETQTTDDSSPEGSIFTRINTNIREIYESQRQFVSSWYHGLSTTMRYILNACTLIGGLVGLVFGLAAPKKASCVAAVFTGSIMIVIAANGLLAGSSNKYAQWLNDSPRTFILSTGLIIIFGVIWQWTIFTRKADE